MRKIRFQILIQAFILLIFFSLVEIQGQAIQERVFVHTDKPYYLTGETLWFKAYCTNQQTSRLSDLSKVLYVELFDENSQPVAQIKSQLRSGTAHGQILLSTSLTTGTYLLRAYTGWMRNSSISNYHQQKLLVINPLSKIPSENLVNNSQFDSAAMVLANQTDFPVSAENNLEVTTSKQAYFHREQVALQLGNQAQENEVLNLSVSVYPYHEPLENQINKYSMVHEEETVASEEGFTYFPETIGPIIYGYMEDGSDTGSPLVSVPGSGARVYQGVNLGTGNYAFQLSPDLVFDQLYLWTNDHDSLPMSFRSVFDRQVPDFQKLALKFDPTTIRFVENQSVNMQVSNLYSEYSWVHGLPPSKTEEEIPFYGQPEFHYPLQDYTRFPGLEEVFIEFIKYVSPRRRGSVLNLFGWDYYTNEQTLANNVFFDQPTLVMLDGVPVRDMDWLMEIEPPKIESIDVVDKRYLLGGTVFYGIVNLISYNQEFTNMEFPGGTKKITMASLQKPLEFYHPDYHANATDLRVPDRRNTLYWNPSIEVANNNRSIDFFTGDSSGDYLIVVKGVSSDGKVFSGAKRISVHKRNMP